MKHWASYVVGLIDGYLSAVKMSTYDVYLLVRVPTLVNKKLKLLKQIFNSLLTEKDDSVKLSVYNGTIFDCFGMCRISSYTDLSL